jgi:hypothetical protein
MSRFITLLAILLQLSVFAQTDTATIMYYNVLNFPGSTPERVSNFRTVTRYINPDIVVITELVSDAGAQILLNQGLNVYGETKYQKAPFINGDDTDNMLFYNSDKFTLYSIDTIDTDLRAIGEYVLYYNLPETGIEEDTVFFHLYAAHLKSSTGTANQQQRLAEVMRFKQHVNAKPNHENIIFGGDLNLYTASEPAYNALIVEGNYPLTDMLPAGSWHDNQSYASIHTQSPRTTQFGGGADGGLDDRFDFMLFSTDLLSGTNKINYISNTYLALGNDGNHMNKALTDLPLNNSVPDSVIQAVYNMSDHLPVISKFAIHPDYAPLTYELALKVNLEGPFNSTEMSAAINPIIPLTSPYGQAPWNLINNPTLSAIPTDDVVDWILVELRDAPNAISATTSTIIGKLPGLLTRDGSVKGLDGYSNLQCNYPVNHQLYIVVYHRNHLAVMSAFPLDKTANVYNYNFTDNGGKAYLNGQKPLVNNIWGMKAGDSDANGLINETDKTSLWNSFAGKKGYLPGDLNFDGEINNSDKNQYLIINYQNQSNVPE